VWFGTVTPDGWLVVGEGIETTQSAMILWGAKAGVATLGTNGMRSLVLPQAARKIATGGTTELRTEAMVRSGLGSSIAAWL
jgi:hypothetical protein